MKVRLTDFRSLLIPGLSIIFVSIISFLASYFHPTPSENLDKMVVALWWATPFFIVLWVTRRVRRVQSHSQTWATPLLFYTVTVSGLALLVIAIFSRSDSYGFYRGFTLFNLAVGLVISAILYFGIWGTRERLSSILIATTVIAVEILALPIFFQWPGNIADAFHFPYIAEEMAAVSVGHFPYSNFIPQYSAFLGYPVAPLLHLWSSSPALVTTLYMQFLQLLSIAIAIALPILVIGRRILAPALIVATFPPLILMRVVDRPITYFATMPIRVIFPAIIILLSFLWIRIGRDLDQKRIIWLVALGAFGGATVLNNLDYGIAAFGAVVITLFFAQKELLLRLRTTLYFLLGSILFLLFYELIARLSGNTVHWNFLLAFPKLFGVENFMAIPIPSFGLHIAFVSLFVTTTAIGISMLLRAPTPANFFYRQGVLLTLTGSFSLLSLAYFSSRSLVPTLISGYSFQVGMCCAALLPLVLNSIRTLRARRATQPQYSLATSLFALITLAPVLAMVTLIGSPLENFRHFADGKSQLEFTELATLRTALNSVVQSQLLAGRGITPNSGQIWQILEMPSVLQGQTGVLSASLTTHPVYLTLSDPSFRDFQCEQLEGNTEIKYLIVERAVSQALVTNSRCSAIFDFPGQSTTASNLDLVLLTRIG